MWSTRTTDRQKLLLDYMSQRPKQDQPELKVLKQFVVDQMSHKSQFSAEFLELLFGYSTCNITDLERISLRFIILKSGLDIVEKLSDILLKPNKIDSKENSLSTL